MKGVRMSNHHTPGALRSLPDRPSLRHLKAQAKDLLKSGDIPNLAGAQLQIARSYGFPSWPALKVHVESLAESGKLKDAIDRNDLPRVQSMLAGNPALHQAPL